MTRTAKGLSGCAATAICNALCRGPGDRADGTFAIYCSTETFLISDLDSADYADMDLYFTDLRCFRGRFTDSIGEFDILYTSSLSPSMINDKIE